MSATYHFDARSCSKTKFQITASGTCRIRNSLYLEDMNNSIIFLDFDDVICMNNPYGGYDVALALDGRGEPEDLWERLFDPLAVAFLNKINDEFQPQYVLSTSWTHIMGRDGIVAALEKAGLDFVVNNLHADWETIKTGSDARSFDIQTWLAGHPEQAGRWVVLDDTLSGVGLTDWAVLCDVRVGLTVEKYSELRRVLMARSQQTHAGLRFEA